MERIVEPERMFMFRVPWVDDQGKVQVTVVSAYSSTPQSALIRAVCVCTPPLTHPLSSSSASSRCFKNSLTGLPMGGGKGGSDFDPKGKSDAEIMRFCQSFMTELCKHIGSSPTYRPAISVLAAVRLALCSASTSVCATEYTGVLTGKGLSYGGSLARTEATGYGLCYFMKEMLAYKGTDIFEGKTVAISGSGNVAIYACQKATQLGAKVVTMSDSNGFIYDPNGINLDVVKDIKEVKRGRIKEYAERVPGSVYTEGQRPWGTKCDIALPCATQNELNEENAKALIANGCKFVAEGANMPSTPEAVAVFQAAGVLWPGKGC